MSFEAGVITTRNVRDLNPQSLLPEGIKPLDPNINGWLKKYFATTVNMLPGPINRDSASRLVTGLAEYESELPLYSVKPFRYAPPPDMPEYGVQLSAESTVVAAGDNMDYMLEHFGKPAFAAEVAAKRTVRAATWISPIDEDFHLHVRGGSGSGTFSIDFGLGVIDRKNRTNVPNYKELWRTGVDTVPLDDSIGARFIRTGSGIKDNDPFKSAAFYHFRRRHNILPQRLLGLIGLYFMRELEPRYAVAFSTAGARHYSTLKNSQGGCDYDGIFKNIGFEAIPTDENWLAIPNFGEGFYKAIVVSKIKRREEAVLYTAVEALKDMEPLNPPDKDTVGQRLFPLCEDDHPSILAQEVAAAYGERRRHWFGLS
jgi:hypothetical protein